MEKLNSLNKLDKSAGQSTDIVADNIAKLKELFPEILTENKIDFDSLKALLGEEIEVDDERYSFNWHGKAQARRLAQSPSKGTLRPCKEDSVDWDATQNLFIEGDNLEVLKLLQKSYHKQVKMIYIDPPYNTGKDFVYPDNYQFNIKNYLELTGQLEGGAKISSNTDASGRFHTDWLNMMYPRLKLARNLLSDNGLVFISIDDNEIKSLRALCDEIFGEENFLASIVWQKIHSTKNDAKYFSDTHEYLLVYAKNIDFVEVKLLERTEKMDARFTNPDSDSRGPWASGDLVANEERKEGYFEVTGPTGKVFDVPKGKHWVYSKQNLIKYIEEGRIWFGKNGDAFPRLKRYLSEVQQGRKCDTIWLSSEVGHNQESKREIKAIFDGADIFDTPKPLRLISRCINLATGPEDIVLDFFAGSGTTGHAVIAENASDGGKRKYVLVQLPEPLDIENKDQKSAADFCDKLGKPRSIAELTKERLHRAGKKIKEESPNYQGDLGFKVFKLDSSNIKPWDADFDSLAQDLAEATEVVKAERSAEDVLFEILLKYGLDLTLPIATHTLEGKTVYEVGAGALVVCLDSGITEAVAEAIGKLKETLEPEVMRVVFKDSGFANDAAKVNAVQVLKQFGIDDVKSI